MEKSIEWQFDDCLRAAFGTGAEDAAAYSPLALAYIGDSVYDLMIKMMVAGRGNRQVRKMHRETTGYVQAKAQSRMMRAIQPELTEEEYHIYKRGRNSKPASPAKNQSIADYRRATGFEALLGYLYLEKRWERMITLVKTGLDSLEEPDREEETDSHGQGTE